MNEHTDSQLLQAYAERRSEAAFAELVRRHVDFVYSAAARMVCDPHLAEDVAQGVFLALAKNAGQLTDRTVLSGWLHRTARNIAAQTVRTDIRRRAREQEAFAMSQPPSNAPDAPWEQIAPHLDAALGELNEPDRDALLMRFFQNQSAQQMAQTMGISGEAAQKRVSRAVERLRGLFAKRGLTVGTSSLVVLLSAHCVQAAPTGLALTISSAAALGGTALAASTATTLTKTIAMTTLQKSLITAVVAAGVATPLFIHHQSQTKLRAANEALSQEASRSAELASENERLSNLITEANSARSVENNELLKLRNEVGTLRRQSNDLAKVQQENQRMRGTQTQTPPPTSGISTDNFPRETWAFAGYGTPESAILSVAWAGASGELQTFLNSMAPQEQARNQENWQREGKNNDQIRESIASEFGRTKSIRILERSPISQDEIVFSLLIEHSNGHPETPRLKLQRIGSEWKIAGPVRTPPPSAH